MTRSRKKQRSPGLGDRERPGQMASGTADHFASGSVPQAGRTGTVLAVCGLLLLAVVTVFGQTVRHEFVNFDDDAFVYENPHVQEGLSGAGIGWTLTSVQGSMWAPLTWISYQLDSQLHGPKAWGYHLTNVLLHAATAILLFLVLWGMTGDLWPSAVVAAVFAIHPLRAESVAWVAERKGLLSGLCFVLSLGAYLWYVRHRFSLVRCLTVAGFFALGLLAKPDLVTLPFLLLLLDYWPLGRMDGMSGSPPAGPSGAGTSRCAACWRLVVEKIPLVLLVIVSCVLRASDPNRSRGGSGGIADALAAGKRPDFLRDLPWASSPGRPAWRDLSARGEPSQPIGKAAAALLVLAAVSLTVSACRRRYPHLFVGWLWYLGMLVPMSGLAQVGSHAMADRYTYLPQIGLCIGLAWTVLHASRSWPYRGLACGIGAAVMLAALMGYAWQQTQHWRDSEALWTRTLACTAKNSLAHNNLGVDLASRGQIDKAIAHYRTALEINPNYADAHDNLGHALAGRGELDEAIAEYRTALKLKPDFAEVRVNLGIALIGRGELDEATVHLRKALESLPDDVQAHISLGAVLARRRQYDEAIAHYRKALEIKPDYAEARNNLGLALTDRGELEEAIAQFLKALEIKPDYAEAHASLGLALADRGRLDEARAHYLKALDLASAHGDKALVNIIRARMRRLAAGAAGGGPP